MTGSPGSREKLNEALKAEGVEVLGSVTEAFAEVLTPAALAFLAKLVRRFDDRRQKLLEMRKSRQEEIRQGKMPDFLRETAEIRASEWRAAPIPSDLQDRRVEITGPPERKMIINALNSGASVYMGDFEDSNSPIWENNVEGQINLRDAVARTIEFTSSDGKQYAISEKTATLMVRPRGLHLPEKHLRVDGQPISGALFDFGLFFFHNAKELITRGTGPYFYLPKLESHFEARWWNDVFTFAESELGVPAGSIRATVLIENILAAFEMDEILYELRQHSAGLNCGRWDYIFSFIKKFRHRADFVLPDRAMVTMDKHFLNSYVQLLIKTCHRRGTHAMGGMAAQIPIKDDPDESQKALDKVRQDKLREVKAGHDGTWVAHPGLVPVAKDIFDAHMNGPNQIDVKRDDVQVGAEDLLKVPQGEITNHGLRVNIDVGIQYLESWLRGSGCVPIYHLMEDAATAEISRAQVWQWVNHRAKMSDGTLITPDLVRRIISEELDQLRGHLGGARFDSGRFDLAGRLFEQMMTRSDFVDFMPLMAYDYLPRSRLQMQ